MPFGNLLFVHAFTNATGDHKYSMFPSADFGSSQVMVSFLELHFLVKMSLLTLRGAEGALPKLKGPFYRQNEAQEMTPKLLAPAKVCSVLGNIRDVS